MSPLAAREIACRYRGGTPLREAARLEIERSAEETGAPRIYAPRPLHALQSPPRPPEALHSPPLPRAFFIAPYELSHTAREVAAGDLHVDVFATLIDAAAVYYPLRAALAALEAARSALISALDIGVARAERTLDAVADDADAAGDAEQHRRWADLLLAYPRAPREGSIATVPDPWANPADPAATLEVPIDPARSLVDNAQTYYGRARRADRSARRTAARRRTLRSRIGTLRKLAAEAKRARDLRDCLRIARAGLTHGVEVRTDRWTVPESNEGADPAAMANERQPVDASAAANERQRGHPPTTANKRRSTETLPAVESSRRAKHSPGVDRYTSSDGFEILVGRNARANERVTHELAAPQDFWLHAEGPGSHVIIRNPGRTEEPSETSLRQAASLAAYFSFARGATKVNVRWTQVSQVKKPRGGPVGQVILRRARTYLAEPLEPAELLGNRGDT
jgi:predicted ribosome quality control (RQC) complex YloA/Tae2 family protein